MNTIGSSGFAPALPLSLPLSQDLRAAQPAQSGFAERLGSAIETVAKSQSSASEAARAYEMGEREDLAGVMVEQQVASLGFQLTLNVRNRALTAYRDIMNMSV